LADLEAARAEVAKVEVVRAARAVVGWVAGQEGSKEARAGAAGSEAAARAVKRAVERAENLEV
jgi:succinyl-CoA synthetase alpha subunit